MTDLNPLRSLLKPHDLTFLGGFPYVYHCHHYNLFHDQTVDDILGDEQGFQVRMRAARSAFADLLEALCIATDAASAVERIQLAQQVFASMGQGQMQLDITADGGTATGHSLHYGHTWSEKYGDKVRRRDPADAVAAGFAAAAAEVAWNLPRGSMEAVEEACLAMREAECRFKLSRVAPEERKGTVDERIFTENLGASAGGEHEERIAGIAATLQQFMRGVAGDERGLIESFGVFITMHLGNYYNQTAFEAVRSTEASAPGLTEMAEGLFQEAGHVCVFNTFGNILLSPEWEAVAGALSSDPLDVIVGSLAIARGLGFGRWSLDEFEPGKRLVISSTSNYEAPFWLANHGVSDRPRCYVFRGAALAMMILATRVDWGDAPVLDAAAYERLFHGAGLGFKVDMPECLTMGNNRSVAVVSLA